MELNRSSSKNLREKSLSCLVIDLDETLVHFFGTIEDWDYIEEYDNPTVKDRILDIKVEGDFMWGIARPFTREFLKIAQNTFDVVGIWSAGVESYVGEIAKELFPNTEPYFVWSRKKCEVMTTDAETVRQKPLSKLFKSYPEIDPNRTLIIDDRSEVCTQDTLIHIDMPIWDATLSDIDRTDNSLRCLGQWFQKVVPTSKNLKTAVTKGIFCEKNLQPLKTLSSNSLKYNEFF